MNPKLELFYLLSFCAFFGGCVDDEDPVAGLDNVVMISGGTGVYLGDDVVLTNWHVCISSSVNDFYFSGDIPLEDYLTLYNADYNAEDAGQVDYVDGVPLDRF